MSPEQIRLVEETASLVATKLKMTPRTRDEFVSNALGRIGEKYHLFDRTLDFGGWCYIVLWSYGVDTIRRHARQRRILERAEERASSGMPDPSGQPGSGQAASDASLKLIEILDRHVRGQDRIIVSIDLKLLCCVEDRRVAGWISDAGLQEDFPWRDIEGVEPQAERRRVLAEALGGNSGWLRQRIRRVIKRLDEELGGPQE